MARYSSKQERPDENGLWYRPQGVFNVDGTHKCESRACAASHGHKNLMEEYEKDWPRTCKKCKEEKPSQDFISQDKKTGAWVYTQWCKVCREERWAYLKTLRPKKKPKPTFDSVMRLAYEAAWSASGDRKREVWKELEQLQEDYIWTAVSKR